MSIGPGAIVDATRNVEIGDGTVIAPRVKIFTRSHNYDAQDLTSLPFDNRMHVAPVVIGRYVWIADSVIILPGVTIGDGAVIGAGAVVAKSIPPYTVVAGNPAQIIKRRNSKRFDELAAKDSYVYLIHGHSKTNIPKNETNIHT